MTTSVKTCFKCGEEQAITNFYRHKMMADGHLNKCKRCTKRDVRSNRKANIEHYRQYDRERGSRQGYAYVVDFRSRFPKKVRAHRKVRYALRAGKLKRQVCEECGSRQAVAHHDDYNKPLAVRWLCQAHHLQWHAKNGEGRNAI